MFRCHDIHSAIWTQVLVLKRSLLFWCIASVVLLATIGCDRSDSGVISGDNRVITGSTMGTYFRVETNCDENLDETAIVTELDRLTLIFSTYREDSEISRVNNGNVGVWHTVDADFVEVAMRAQRVYVASGGAFDPPVGELVERWGFGVTEQDSVPLPAEIREIRGKVGYEHVESRSLPPAVKKHVDIRLDFSAIAKGFAVDRLVDLVASNGCEHYLVDIGGDVRVKGFNAQNKPWRIGIQHPFAPDQVAGFVEMTEGAVATSGTYTNVKLIDGESLNHLIDPRTGTPVTHELISVSVLSDSAMTADAWATALIVLDLEEGLALTRRWELSALVFEQTTKGEFDVHRTGEFEHIFAEL